MCKAGSVSCVEMNILTFPAHQYLTQTLHRFIRHGTSPKAAEPLLQTGRLQQTGSSRIWRQRIFLLSDLLLIKLHHSGESPKSSLFKSAILSQLSAKAATHGLVPMMPRSEAEHPSVRPTKDEVNNDHKGGWISELNLKASAGRIRPSNAHPTPHEVQHRAAGVGPRRSSHAARAIAGSSCSKISAASWKRSQRRRASSPGPSAPSKKQEPPSFLANRVFGDIFYLSQNSTGTGNLIQVLPSVEPSIAVHGQTRKGVQTKDFDVHGNQNEAIAGRAVEMPRVWISDNYPGLAYEVDHAGCEKELESCASMLGTSRILPYRNRISQLCFSRSSHSPSSTTPGGAKMAICRGPKPNLSPAAQRTDSADEGVLPSGTETNSETDGLQIGAQPEINPSGGSPQCPTGLHRPPNRELPVERPGCILTARPHPSTCGGSAGWALFILTILSAF